MNDSDNPKHIPSFAEIRAALAEVAIQNKETAALAQESWKQIIELKAQMAKTDAQMAENAAQMAKTDAQMAENAAQMAKTDAQMAENATQMAENAAQMARTDAQIAKTDKEINKLLRSTKELHSNVKNEADACEQRFIASLRRHKLVIAGVTFDEIYSNQKKDRKGEHIELDGLLVNGDSIAILEVKKRLHLNDVEKVRDNLIGRFRKLYPEHQHKRLMVLVAGDNINDDAAAAALEAGFIVLSFKARRLQMQDEQLRYY